MLRATCCDDQMPHCALHLRARLRETLFTRSASRSLSSSLCSRLVSSSYQSDLYVIRLYVVNTFLHTCVRFLRRGMPPCSRSSRFGRMIPWGVSTFLGRDLYELEFSLFYSWNRACCPRLENVETFRSWQFAGGLVRTQLQHLAQHRRIYEYGLYIRSIFFFFVCVVIVSFKLFQWSNSAKNLLSALLDHISAEICPCYARINF